MRLALLAQILEAAVDYDYIKRNPASDARKPPLIPGF
jgi:hypothetical protein